MSNVTSEDILKLSGGGKCLSGGTTPISLDNEDMAGGGSRKLSIVFAGDHFSEVVK